MSSNAITIRDKVNHLQQQLEARQKVIAKSLPAHVLSQQRFQQVILTACAQNPKLLDCQPASLIGSIIRGASLGLDPEPAIGQMYLVPFKGVVQLIIGYKGLCNLGWQSGMLEAYGAAAVREGDAFDYELGSKAYLKHKPKLDNEGELIAFHATARIIGAKAAMFDVMGIKAVRGVQAKSPSARMGGNSPWHTHFEEMAKKTVLRRLSKLLPASTEKSANLQHAINLDERAELGMKQHNAELLEEDEAGEVDEQALADGAAQAEQEAKNQEGK